MYDMIRVILMLHLTSKNRKKAHDLSVLSQHQIVKIDSAN